MRDFLVMRTATRLLTALAVVAVGGALQALPAGATGVVPAAGPLPGQVTTVPTTAPAAPGVPTLATTVPLPTQVTSLSPVTAPPTTADTIDDASATRIVNRVIMVLVGLGLLVGLLTFWYWRATKPVPPSLDGLDLMSTRKWLRGKPAKRARLLGDFHAKRGPVPEETIARTGAQSVRVGAAVAAPAPQPSPAPSPSLDPRAAPVGAVVGSDGWAVAASPDRSPSGGPDGASSLGALVGPLVGPAPGGEASGPSGTGDQAAVPVDGTDAAAPASPESPDGAFTVVARRPRGESGDQGQPG